MYRICIHFLLQTFYTKDELRLIFVTTFFCFPFHKIKSVSRAQEVRKKHDVKEFSLTEFIT